MIFKISIPNNNFNNFTFKQMTNNRPAQNHIENKDKFEMSIGYVNDIHGQTNNMMRILSGIKGDLRLSAGDNDIGDEKNVGVHKATTTFLNIAGIKATALGNHELDTSQADCINLIKNFDGDVLSINYKQKPIKYRSEEDIKKLSNQNKLAF